LLPRAVEDIKVLSQSDGVHIKTGWPRGGVVSDITYRNIEFGNVGECILVDIGGGPITNASAMPTVRNILFENIHCAHGEIGAYSLGGLAESPVGNMSFVNVTIGPRTKPCPPRGCSCGNVNCTCDALTQPCPHCCTRATA
jgi:hypothetical protein